MNAIAFDCGKPPSARSRKGSVPDEDFRESTLRCRDEIVDRIRASFHASCPPTSLRVGGLEASYWSLVFRVGCLECGTGQFVKVPKAEWHDWDIVTITSDHQSLKMAQNEFRSLEELYAFSSGLEDAFGAIKPLAYWPEYNAIITELAYGRDLYELCREDTPLWRQGLSPSTKGLLRDCGVWLSMFHQSRSILGPRNCVPADTLTSVDIDIQFMLKNGLPRSMAASLRDRLRNLHTPFACRRARSVSGFEVRNVLVSEGRLIILDPGEIQEGCVFDDVARFLVSLDALYWGTPRFLLPLPLGKEMRDAFLEGYRAYAPLDAHALWLGEIKQFVWYWKEAYAVLAIKDYSRPVRSLVRKLYIDRFYSKAVINRLEALGG